MTADQVKPATESHPMPRITCPKCGNDVALHKYGRIRRHAAARGAWRQRGSMCPASGTFIEGWRAP